MKHDKNKLSSLIQWVHQLFDSRQTMTGIFYFAWIDLFLSFKTIPLLTHMSFGKERLAFSTLNTLTLSSDLWHYYICKTAIHKKNTKGHWASLTSLCTLVKFILWCPLKVRPYSTTKREFINKHLKNFFSANFIKRPEKSFEIPIS